MLTLTRSSAPSARSPSVSSPVFSAAASRDSSCAAVAPLGTSNISGCRPSPSSLSTHAMTRTLSSFKDTRLRSRSSKALVTNPAPASSSNCSCAASSASKMAPSDATGLTLYSVGFSVPRATLACAMAKMGDVSRESASASASVAFAATDAGSPDARALERRRSTFAARSLALDCSASSALARSSASSAVSALAASTLDGGRASAAAVPSNLPRPTIVSVSSASFSSSSTMTFSKSTSETTATSSAWRYDSSADCIDRTRRLTSSSSGEATRTRTSSSDTTGVFSAPAVTFATERRSSVNRSTCSTIS